MKNFITPIILCLSLFMVSCDPLMVYDEYQKTQGEVWRHGDIKNFTVEMQDTVTTYNVLFNVRHSTDYPLSNLYVFLTITGPDGLSIKDTLQVIIADSRGKWMGHGFGKLKHISRMYKKNVRFSHQGTYTFTVEQGMRQAEIPVSDVGIRIEEFRNLR
jgi:gliding motility-associated lipoprotein GldH